MAFDPRGSGTMRRTWQALAVRGVVSVAFGLLSIAWPGITVLALALVFGVYALADGFGLLGDAFRHADRGHRVARFLTGVLGIVAGVIMLAWPGVTVVVVATLAGLWAIVTGVGEIAAAIRLRRTIRNEVLLALAGLLAVVAGIILVFDPFTGAVAVAIFLGWYALISGIVLLALAWRVRRHA